MLFEDYTKLFHWTIDNVKNPKTDTEVFYLLLEPQKEFLISEIRKDPNITDFKFWVQRDTMQLIGRSKKYYKL